MTRVEKVVEGTLSLEGCKRIRRYPFVAPLLYE